MLHPFRLALLSLSLLLFIFRSTGFASSGGFVQVATYYAETEEGGGGIPDYVFFNEMRMNENMMAVYWDANLRVYGIENVFDPKLLLNHTDDEYFGLYDDMILGGGRLYALGEEFDDELGPDYFYIWDFRDRSNIRTQRFVYSEATDGAFTGAAAWNDYVFFPRGTGFGVVDYHSISSPEKVGRVSGAANDGQTRQLIISNHYMFARNNSFDHSPIYTMKNIPPHRQGSLSTVKLQDALWSESYVFVANGSGDNGEGLKLQPEILVYDLHGSDPQNVTSLEYGTGAIRLWRNGSRLYCFSVNYSYYQNIVRVFDIGTNAQLSLQNCLPTNGRDSMAYMQNGYVFVAEGGVMPIYRYIPQTPLDHVSNATFLIDTLAKDGQLYSDRPYQWKEPIPPVLRDQPMILTRNDDKNSTASTVLEFDVEEPGTLYIAVDERMTTLPAWIGDHYELTSLRLATDDHDADRILYRRAVPAGHVALGPNRDPATPAVETLSMYSVFFVPTRAAANYWEIYQ